MSSSTALGLGLAVVTDEDEIRDAFLRLRSELSDGAKTVRRHLGWRGGGGEYDVLWRESDGFWAVLDDHPSRNRYWCSYGVVNPEKHTSLPIVVEVNPTRVGRDRRHGGAFLRSADGSLYYGHDGRVAGGKKGVGKGAFLATLSSEATTEVSGPSGRETFVVVGQLGSKHLPIQLRAYIEVVRAFKSGEIKAPVVSGGKAFLEHPEFAGQRRPFRYGSVVESRVDHGVITGSLAQELKQRGLVPMRDVYRDVYVTDSSGSMSVLFEIKTAVDTGSVYSAVGQLLYHSAANPTCRRIAVLADRVTDSTRQVLAALGIEVMTFSWVKGYPQFDDLDRFVLATSGG